MVVVGAGDRRGSYCSHDCTESGECLLKFSSSLWCLQPIKQPHSMGQVRILCGLVYLIFITIKYKRKKTRNRQCHCLQEVPLDISASVLVQLSPVFSGIHSSPWLSSAFLLLYLLTTSFTYLNLQLMCNLAICSSLFCQAWDPTCYILHYTLL